MTTLNQLKSIIETATNKSVELISSNDCANLLFTAVNNNNVIANIYKSFDKNLNEVTIIRYAE